MLIQPLLLFLPIAATATAFTPVETTLVKHGEGVPVNVYAPPREKADGRVVLLLHGGDWGLHPAEWDTGKQAADLVQRGCLVIAADLSRLTAKSRADTFKVYEHMWRGLVNNYAAKYAGAKPRLLPVPAGFGLADPITFYRAGKEEITLDLIYPQAGQPSPTLIRIDSGTFGLQQTFSLVVAGFATAIVRDPRNDLNLLLVEVGRYGAAAARALRANAEKYRLSGKIGIYGLSKHGFCAGLIGAYNPRIQATPDDLHPQQSGRI